MPQVTVATPEWSKASHLLSSRDTTLELRYLDLWRAYRGEAIRIDRLRASALDGNFERLADGRGSWQFRAVESPPPTDALVPSFGKLEVAQGLIRYVDVPFKIDIEARRFYWRWPIRSWR